ncbi:MAG: MBL fold metallo-hydrolase [Terriglobales bacterium]
MAPWQVRVLVPGLPLQSCSVLLTDMHGQHILVDTGFPQHDAILLDGLQRAGVAPADIRGVINTHFHLDHCGGNFLFPQAWVYGSKVDFDWAISIYESVCGGETRREVFRNFYPEATEEEFDRMDEARVLQLLQWMWDPATLGSLERYRWWEERDLDLAGLRILPTTGHTPGHLSLQVNGVEAPRIGLDLPLDVRCTAFEQRVWQVLRDIPAGETATCAAITQRAGSPRAA